MRHSYPVSFKVKGLAGFIDVEGVLVNPDLAIGPDITKEMMRQPGLYAYYGALAEEEYRRGKRIKYKLHCLSEELDVKYRKEATTGKRTTEKEISNKVKRHPQMRALYDRYIATMRRAGHLKVLKDAFEQRHHQIQSIGAMTRREAESELRTLQKKAQLKLTNK